MLLQGLVETSQAVAATRSRLEKRRLLAEALRAADPGEVVEIAFDGVQRSTRYLGGVALRFARVLRYRDDKSAAEADTIQTLQAMLGPR